MSVPTRSEAVTFYFLPHMMEKKNSLIGIVFPTRQTDLWRMDTVLKWQKESV